MKYMYLKAGKNALLLASSSKHMLYAGYQCGVIMRKCITDGNFVANWLVLCGIGHSAHISPMLLTIVNMDLSPISLLLIGIKQG